MRQWRLSDGEKPPLQEGVPTINKLKKLPDLIQHEEERPETPWIGDTKPPPVKVSHKKKMEVLTAKMHKKAVDDAETRRVTAEDLRGDLFLPEIQAAERAAIDAASHHGKPWIVKHVERRLLEPGFSDWESGEASC